MASIKKIFFDKSRSNINRSVTLRIIINFWINCSEVDFDNNILTTLFEEFYLKTLIQKIKNEDNKNMLIENYNEITFDATSQVRSTINLATKKSLSKTT